MDSIMATTANTESTRDSPFIADRNKFFLKRKEQRKH